MTRTRCAGLQALLIVTLAASPPGPAIAFDKAAVLDAEEQIEGALAALASGDPERAAGLARLAVTANSEQLGEFHLWTIASRETLARSLLELGDVRGALEQLDRTEVILREYRDLGLDGGHYAYHLALIGRAYSQAGHRERGLGLIEEATSLAATLPDPRILHDLQWIQARQLVRLGRHEEAHAVLSSRRQSAVTDDPSPSAALGADLLLAETQVELGSWNEAGETLAAAARQVELLPPDDGAVFRAEEARLRSELARHRGLLDEAIAQGEAASELLRSAVGTSHPAARRAFSTLALAYLAAGRHEKALSLFLTIAAEVGESSGEGHPDFVTAMGHAAVCARLGGVEGDPNPGLDLATRAEAAAYRRIHAELGVLRHDVREALVRRQRHHLDLVLSLALEGIGSDDWQHHDDVVEAIWRWKGVVLATTATEHASAGGEEDDPHRSRLRSELAAERWQLSVLILGPEHRGRRADWDQRRMETTVRKLRLERELAEWCEPSVRAEPGSLVRAAGVREALPADVVLVDLVRFNRTRVQRSEAGDTRRPTQVGRPWYLAVVCTRDSCRLADLGPAEELERVAVGFATEAARVGATYESLTRAAVLPTIPPAPGGRAGTSDLDLGRFLLNHWGIQRDGSAEPPVEMWLRPDGPLAVVPFAAMPVGEGQFLAQRTTLVYLASVTQLLEPRSSVAAGTRGMLAVGDPAFRGADQPACTATHRRSNGAPLPDDSLPPAYELAACVQPMARSWCPLPGTRREVNRLTRRARDVGMDIKLLLGARATRDNLLQAMPGRRFVHVATHGYFLPDVCLQSPGETTAPGGSNDLAPPTKRPVDPWILSGLVFPDPETRESPQLLPSSDILDLDLRGTQLVTLSACETGRGRITEGEGVLGLRSAFALAGAEGLVLSLWSIEDDGAADFMDRFYGELMSARPPSAETALRRAMEAAILGDEGASPAPPSVWGAFTYTGPPASRLSVRRPLPISGAAGLPKQESRPPPISEE